MADPGAWRRCPPARACRRVGKRIDISAVEVLGDADTLQLGIVIAVASEPRQRITAGCPRLPARGVAVKFQKIEGVQERAPRTLATDSSAERIEIGQPMCAVDVIYVTGAKLFGWTTSLELGGWRSGAEDLFDDLVGGREKRGEVETAQRADHAIHFRFFLIPCSEI